MKIDAVPSRMYIHSDELGTRLAKLSLLSEMAAAEDRPNKARLLSVSDTAREAARSLDELVWTLKPNQNALADFAGYLTDSASELLDGTDIALRLHVPDDLPDLTIAPHVRLDLLLAWKESLGNALKHSEAGAITNTLTLENKVLTLSTADSGVGLPGDEELARKRATGNGLRTN